MTYARLALAILNLITRIISLVERESWMNEGERRLIARQLKENQDALARALHIEREIQDLNDEAVRQRAEAEGWLRD